MVQNTKVYTADESDAVMKYEFSQWNPPCPYNLHACIIIPFSILVTSFKTVMCPLLSFILLHF